MGQVQDKDKNKDKELGLQPVCLARASFLTQSNYVHVNGENGDLGREAFRAWLAGVYYLHRSAELAFFLLSFWFTMVPAAAAAAGERDPLLLLPCCAGPSKSTVMSSTIHLGETTSPTVTGSGEHTCAEERCMASRVNRKLDIALLPFLSLLYLFNGLDRSNVGNAETQGMYVFLRSISDGQVFPGFPARLLIARTPKGTGS
jgi:hypothetical protein